MQPEGNDTNADDAVAEVRAMADRAGLQLTLEDAHAMAVAVERNRGYARVARSFVSKDDEPAHVFEVRREGRNG